jgi:hypothetical protein
LLKVITPNLAEQLTHNQSVSIELVHFLKTFVFFVLGKNFTNDPVKIVFVPDIHFKQQDYTTCVEKIIDQLFHGSKTWSGSLLA